MISLRQRLKAERKRADAVQTKLAKAITLAEENAADALFLREAVKVHLTAHFRLGIHEVIDLLSEDLEHPTMESAHARIADAKNLLEELARSEP